jgi:hypothetical protein
LSTATAQDTRSSFDSSVRGSSPQPSSSRQAPPSPRRVPPPQLSPLDTFRFPSQQPPPEPQQPSPAASQPSRPKSGRARSQTFTSDRRPNFSRPLVPSTDDVNSGERGTQSANTSPTEIRAGPLLAAAGLPEDSAGRRGGRSPGLAPSEQQQRVSPDSVRSAPFSDQPPERPRSRSSIKSTDSRASRSSKGSGWRIFDRRSSKASSEAHQQQPRLSSEFGSSPMASPAVERQKPVYHIPPPTAFQYGPGPDEVERLNYDHRSFRPEAGPSLSSNQQRRPSPAPSRNSIYSNYSFYTFPPDDDGIRSPSPTPSQSISQRAYSPPPSAHGGGYGLQGGGHSTFAKTKASFSFPKTPGQAKRDITDPNYCLQLGITHHEKGELERAAYYFERAAKERGGCGPGMLLWGLSLRHGWGCHANPSLAFSFLQKAAESVVEDLDRVVKHGLELGDKEREAKAAKVLNRTLDCLEWKKRLTRVSSTERACFEYLRTWAMFLSRMGSGERQEDGQSTRSCFYYYWRPLTVIILHSLIRP